jgi:hypothetical protein
MQAIFRSRVPPPKRGKAPTRIEVSFTMKATEKTCTKNGHFDDGTARGMAITEFTELFGADFTQVVMGRRAYWTMEVIADA